MATQAQLDEKARQDRMGALGPTLEDLATPAQLAAKARKDEAGSSAFATSAQLAEKGRRNGPPPLPPRGDSAYSSASFYAPPPYTSDDAKRSELISEQWRSNDPRSSSTHSLVPSESGRDGRRTLLLIFIHGFMGNETSFQSFPAHVHNLLTITLVDTHVVHTKIYPRYKSRKAIEFARDDFSNWLEPHESSITEVVLLGHSMGGLLAAEVALQKTISPATGTPFRHRLLGTINFDTPFLGMHPGVVVSGLGSLFRPAPDPPGPRQQSANGAQTPSMDSQASASYAPSMTDSSSQSQLSLIQSITSPLASPPPKDPFFNPPFPNDIRLPERKGWSNVLHFVNKHSDGLTSATKQYFMSHLEFGGCMADYPGLKNRYERIRALEDVDDRARRDGPAYRPPTRRIRFVNYYTASTGRPKVPKPPKSPEIPLGQMLDVDGHLQPIEVEMQDITLDHPRSRSLTPTLRIAVEEHRDGAVTSQKLDDAPDASPIEVREQMQNLGENSGVQNDVQESPPPMRHIDSMPIEDDDIYSDPLPEPVLSPSPVADEKALGPTSNSSTAEEPTPELQHAPTEPPLPPIPPMPIEPEAINLDVYTDKDSRKIAEKEHKRIMKVYNQAIKDRESAIKDRKKLVEKRDKQARQEREKQMKVEEKQRMKEEKEKEKQRLREEKEEEKRNVTINPEQPRERQASSAGSAGEDNKPKRDKKFCMLPPEYGGKRDKTWIRVYMEGVDEVGAHCGLFFPGPQYESLVGDVGERISKWVEEDAASRAIRGEERG